MTTPIDERTRLSDAARWFIRRRQHGADLAARHEFNAWLDRSFEHELEYMNCELAVELATDLEADPELRPLIEECRALSRAHRASRQEASSRLARWSRMRVPLVAASLVVAACLAVVAVRDSSAARYETQIGEQRTIITADDSVVTLNTDTALVVRIDGAARRVWLQRGQAFFSVTPDARRPFEVVARDGIVRAIGTSFDVAMSDEAGNVKVTVLEGSVEIVPRSAPPDSPARRGTLAKVLHGQSAVYSGGAAIAQIATTGVQSVTAWREGKMDFHNQRLADALAEHNRYTNKKIVLGEEDLKDLRISGVLRIGDTEGFLFLLKESLGLAVVHRAGVIVLVSASGSQQVYSAHPHPGTV